MGPYYQSNEAFLRKVYLARLLRGVLCLILAFSVARASGASWPLVTIREACAPGCVPTLRQILAIHGKYRGSVDEIWLSHNGIFSDDKTVRDLSELSELRPDFERAGIVMGFQQGFTLGHGDLAMSGILPEEMKEVHSYPDDAWSVGRDGRRLGMLCPRSPAVQTQEAHYVGLVARELRPASFWLDDDLRLGCWKEDACFCPRCIAAFNQEEGERISREELVDRLFVREGTDAIRSKWFRFNDRSCAQYAAAVRQALDRSGTGCRLGLQQTPSLVYYNGVFRTAWYSAASGNGKSPIGVRIFGGMYSEEVHPRAQVWALYGIMHMIAEAKRLSPGQIASFSYENDNYSREAINKSAEAILRLSGLALAAGCDATTMYTYWQYRAEPLALVDEFAALLAEWRPYYERLAAISRRTSPCGVAFRADPDLPNRLPDDLKTNPAKHGKSLSAAFESYNKDNSKLALYGIPVVPCGAGEVALLTSEEFVGMRMAGMQEMTTAETERLRDLLDVRSCNRMPVRVSKNHALAVYPRVDGEGRLVSVTFFNLSMGTARAVPVFLRRPAGRRFFWFQETQAPVELSADDGRMADERRIVLPNIPGYSMATLVVED